MTEVKIKVTFVVPKDCKSENDCTEDMLIAFTTCDNHRGGGLQAAWAREESISFDQPPMKNDIYVLSEFKGELYEKLKDTKCLLVGPRCLSCSLTEGSTIPSHGHPVYTVAMRGLIVTLSGLSKELKTSLKQKIEWMGGTYSAVLSSDTTHLIANNVFSDKYVKAAERGVPVMKETWVDAVWEASLKLDINGSSSEFNSHRLPPFANLQITTSGLNSHDKKLIMKLVNANGGDFSRVFLSQTTDVVVLTKDSTTSEKYKAATEFGKVCVTPHWIKDSAAQGFALPVSRYKVNATTTSSPIRGQVPDMSLNLTRIARESNPNFVDESKISDSSVLSGTSKLAQESKKDGMDEIQKAFEAFDVTAIKKAGPIFDGFCIWVSGLDGIPRERAWACVSRAGGTRYDGPNSRVTHAVSWGPAAAAAAAALPAVPILSPLWLIRSVEAGRVLDESEFLINTEPATPRKNSQPAMAAASPMSKRSLQLLLPPPEPKVAEEPERDHIVDHYLSQHQAQQQAAESNCEEPACEEDTQSENIFKNCIFEVQGLEDEAICEIGAEIRAEGGLLVAAGAGAGGTHVLVPLDFDKSQLITSTAEAVTVFWVKDCLSSQTLTPIEYYHRPIHLKSPAANPLHGIVASLSTYSGVERAFLDELAKLCGAAMQQRFCRRTNNSALASTHLICPEPTGAKYTAARKWGVPVVRASWLLACAETGDKVDEAGHSVDAPEADEPFEGTSPATRFIAVERDAKENTPMKMLNDLNNEPFEGTSPATRSIAVERDAKENTPMKTLNDLNNEPFEGTSPATRSIAVERDGTLTKEDAKENTHIKTLNESNDEPFEGTSPPTRSIAVERDGTLTDTKEDAKENTPTKTPNDSNASFQNADALKTPPMEEVLSSANLKHFSPHTREILRAIRRGEVPDEPMRTPVNPLEIKTPDSSYGAILRPGVGRMSIDSRKQLWKFVHELPTNENRREDMETPPSKMAKFKEDQSAGGAIISELPTTPLAPPKPSMGTMTTEVDEQLQRLNVVLTGRKTPRRASRAPVQQEKPHDMEYESGPESQPNTVGWDDTTPSQKDSFDVTKPQRVETITIEGPVDKIQTEILKDEKADTSKEVVVVSSAVKVEKPVETKKVVKRFMLSSNVDNREETVEMILRLGGEVTDLEDEEDGPPATHLLCCAPARSQRVLNCIACGCWVLHPAYVARSAAAGMFLTEEEYEWGNPLATCLPAVSGGEKVLAAAAHRWRTRRARSQPGPFAGLVALLHAPEIRRKLLARLVKAGEGTVVEEEPPYTDESINVCFADPKRYPMKERDRAWLVTRGVPVCASILLSAFLTEENRPDLYQHCLPEFKQ